MPTRARLLRALALAWVTLVVGTAGCAETVRCPEGQIFDATGACIPIPDAGPRPDAGSIDAGS